VPRKTRRTMVGREEAYVRKQAEQELRLLKEELQRDKWARELTDENIPAVSERDE
jgi:hypothetical protein